MSAVPFFQAHNAGVAAFCFLTYGPESFVRAEYFGPKDVRLLFDIPNQDLLRAYYAERKRVWAIINAVEAQNEELARTDDFTPNPRI